MTVKKIVLTGPESTGKTFLAKYLAKHFNTTWNPEYARFYLTRQQGNYVEEDIIRIAKGQLQWEKIWSMMAKKVIFCDTALLVPKIWSSFKYGRVAPELQMLFQTTKYDLYLLCSPDLEWTYDPLRENPNELEELYQLYLNELKINKLPFFKIDGALSERGQKAIKIVKEIL